MQILMFYCDSGATQEFRRQFEHFIDTIVKEEVNCAKQSVQKFQREGRKDIEPLLKEIHEKKDLSSEFSRKYVEDYHPRLFLVKATVSWEHFCLVTSNHPDFQRKFPILHAFVNSDPSLWHMKDLPELASFQRQIFRRYLRRHQRDAMRKITLEVSEI